SNAKAYIQGTYHGIDEKYLQRYLDEFNYRFNRRLSTPRRPSGTAPCGSSSIPWRRTCGASGSCLWMIPSCGASPARKLSVA
ncbi:MAG: transposase, partial [Desulfovibrionaceae bacterium]|nr:transposase [Desulfovibrionaceae bacterium]